MRNYGVKSDRLKIIKFYRLAEIGRDLDDSVVAHVVEQNGNAFVSRHKPSGAGERYGREIDLLMWVVVLVTQGDAGRHA